MKVLVVLVSVDDRFYTVLLVNQSMLLEEFNNIESNNGVYDVTNITGCHENLIYKGEFDPS